MIGPSSGPSKMPAREVIENPVGLKRKVFDDLDIDSLCEEVCQNGKKRFITDLRGTLESSVNLQELVASTEFMIDHEQVSNNVNSVARLEVLVVDGNWDSTNIEENPEFTDISNTTIHTLDDVQGVDNGYETILEYWESPNTSETMENIHENIVHTHNNTNTLPVTCNNNNAVEDQENGNLSWLLDFKLDSLIEAPEERNTFTNTRDNQFVHRNRFSTSTTRVTGTTDTRKNYNQTENVSVSSSSISSISNEIRQPIVSNGSYTLTDTRSFAISRYGGPKKPPFTYTELIEHALQERGELTVSAIYQWISEHFPYYKSNDDRWKNSVRHNLSINPHFRKGSKAPHGAGHLWAIANRGDTRPRQLTTNGSILPVQRQVTKIPVDSITSRKPNNVNNQTVTMDEVAAATASISQPEEITTATPITNSVTLEHCAEQILSGIKREVEVQYLVPMVVTGNETQNQEQHLQIQSTEQTEQTSKDTERDCWNVLADFLNPVSKEEVAEECGLIGESYLVTDLNPTALGLNMVEPEIITPDNLFGEELSFQFYELTSPSQLQSA